MRRFYFHLGEKLKHFPIGREIVYHISRHYRIYENVEALYTALILALLIKAFIFEAYKIPSRSMLDTLKVNDRIFVSKFVYDFEDVHVGDVVVFRTKGLSIYQEDKPYYIKRVVGLPGDLLEIQGGHIYRNGKLMDNPVFFTENEYVSYGGRREFRVPDGQIYVFGDNSRNSSDSRAWGGVPLENIVGKAFFRYWPPSRFGFIDNVPPETVRREYARRESSSSGGFHNTAEADEH